MAVTRCLLNRRADLAYLFDYTTFLVRGTKTTADPWVGSAVVVETGVAGLELQVQRQLDDARVVGG